MELSARFEELKQQLILAMFANGADVNLRARQVGVDVVMVFGHVKREDTIALMFDCRGTWGYRSDFTGYEIKDATENEILETVLEICLAEAGLNGVYSALLRLDDEDDTVMHTVVDENKNVLMRRLITGMEKALEELRSHQETEA